MMMTRKRPGPAPKYVHTISFRIDDEQALLAAGLRDAMPYGSWAEVGRYLLSDPVIVARIKQKVRGESEPPGQFCMPVEPLYDLMAFNPPASDE